MDEQFGFSPAFFCSLLLQSQLLTTQTVFGKCTGTSKVVAFVGITRPAALALNVQVEDQVWPDNSSSAREHSHLASQVSRLAVPTHTHNIVDGSGSSLMISTAAARSSPFLNFSCSHSAHASPLSSNQEVSAFGDDNNSDQGNAHHLRSLLSDCLQATCGVSSATRRIGSGKHRCASNICRRTRSCLCHTCLCESMLFFVFGSVGL